MPYASKKQSRFMHSQHPEIAAKWDKEYPNQKGLPETSHKKKSSLENRILLTMLLKEASHTKVALPNLMGMVEGLGAKVGPWLNQELVAPVVGGIKSVAGMKPDMVNSVYQPIKSTIAGPASAAAEKVLPYAERASNYLGNAGNKVDWSHMAHMGPASVPVAESPNAARNIGLATVAGLGGLGAMGLHNRNKEAEAAIGTPFMDGMISYCLTHNLDGNQVLDLLEKGAQLDDRTGKECKDFLDRLTE